MRDAINVETRLSITLRFLATGNSFEDLKFLYAVSPQSIGKIIVETCDAISTVLKDNIKVPNTSEDWKTEAEKFQLKSGFPHCIELSMESTCIVLMAVVNADSEFLMIDVGSNGRISDGGVFSNTKFFKKLENKQLHIPSAEVICPTGTELSYVFVADDAFSLRQDLMKPFTGSNLTQEQEIFNKKLGSARVKVENAFIILAARFRVLLTTIALCPEKTTKIVQACAYLHNFLKKRRGNLYSHIQTVNNSSTQSTPALIAMEPSSSRNSSIQAKNMRTNFCEAVNYLHKN